MNPLSTGALQGITVIDLSRVLGGPYCTQILADHGADVLKVEPPQGDETRGWGPPFDSHGTASYFLGLNRNKRGITVDLSCDDARAQLLALLADADVLVENFKTDTLEKWGLGWDTLSQRFPRLVHCRVSGFGADGPLGGLPGDDVANHLLDGRVPGRSGNAHPNICPYDTYATATQPIFLAVGNDGQFAMLCRLIGADELSGDPRFANNGQRSIHRDALKQLLEARLAAHDCQALADRLVRAGVPCAPIQDVATALAAPHTQHRGMVVAIGDHYRGVASPIKLSRTPATYRLPPP